MGYVVSIDPGKHIGVALWRSTGELLWKDVMEVDVLDDYLEAQHGIHAIVVEDYVTDPWKKQGGSTQQASQVLGMVKSCCRRHGITLVVQKNTILRVAAMHAGVSIPKKGHIKDDLSAMLHGFYYFESIGMRARDIRI